MSFKKLLCVLFILFAFIPGIPVAYFSAQHFRAEVERSYTEHLLTTVDIEAENINHFFRSARQNLLTLVLLPDLQTLMRGEVNHDTSAAHAQRRSALNDYLAVRASLLNNVEYIAVVDVDNVIIASSVPGQIRSASSIDTSAYPLALGRPCITPLCQKQHIERLKKHFSIIAPVFIDGVLTGAVISSYNLTPFETAFQRARLFDSTNLILMDDKGTLVTSPGPETTSQSIHMDESLRDFRDALANLNLVQDPSGMVRYTLGGKERLAYYHVVAEPNWLLLSAIDVSETKKAWATFWGVLTLLAVSVLLAAVGAGILVSRRILRPVDAFLSTIHSMQAGNMDARFHYTHNNELGRMAHVFNGLMDSVRQRTAALQMTTEALQRSKQQVETLAHSVPGGLYRCEPGETGAITFYSDGFLRIWHISREEFSRGERNKFKFLIHPRDRSITLRSKAQQLEDLGSFEVEYRIITSDANWERWVVDKGEQTLDPVTGMAWIEGVVTDISEQKQVQRYLRDALAELRQSTERLKISEERFRLVVEQTSDIIFEWNAYNNVFYISGSFQKRFGYMPGVDKGFRNLTRSLKVHPEDRRALAKWMLSLMRGEERPQADFRMLTAEGDYLWNHFSATSLRGKSGRVVRVVGVLADVHEAKMRELELINKAERDPLSGLYNRLTFEEKAAASLDVARRQRAALAFLFIDIDDFRKYNTQYGHAFGDRVISFIGQVLQNSVQRFGFAGRRGGDEFVACIFGKTGPQQLAELAKDIQAGLNKGIATRERAQVTVSCSLGIVRVEKADISLDALLHEADTAMYDVKQRGKDGFHIITL